MKKFHTIYADPPWRHVGGKSILDYNAAVSSEVHYPLMKLEEIIAMRDFVLELAEHDCHLYLWVTNPFLERGLRVMNAWGFKYKNKIDWLKTTKKGKLCCGLGHYLRGCSESCLFGIKGQLPYKKIEGKKIAGRTGIISVRRQHSEKPEEMRKMIEQISYPPYIELFARKNVKGWTVWGDEV